MDLYVLLGIERAATLNDIKRAYKRLARKYHPDINPGDRMAEQHFRRIAEAYETLIDPERRQRYDAAGAVIAGPATAAFGFEGFDFTISASGAAASTFGDLFADSLTAPFASDTPQRGADIHQTLSLTLEQACAGAAEVVTVTRQERCGSCSGRGVVRAAERRCQVCHGTGAVRSARGHMVFSKPCAGCRGTGVIAFAVCSACGGRQADLRAETLRVALPAGVQHGDQVRVAGKGHAGRHGGEPGDLTLTIALLPHPVFRRDGDDLQVLVPIGVHEAALGARIDVPAIDGRPARVRVLPGTQSGQRFRLSERGLPSARTGARGDLVVEVRIVLPAVLDERSKELLREFGRINSGDVRAATPAEGWRP